MQADLSAPMRHLAPSAFAFVLLAAPVLAQERAVEMRSHIVELARVIGESHALRQACEGSEDQYWRDRMVRLSETEQADPVLDKQMKDGFNIGFAEAKRLYPRCGDDSRQALVATLARGKQLSSNLAKAQYRTGVTQPPAEGEEVTAEPAPR